MQAPKRGSRPAPGASPERRASLRPSRSPRLFSAPALFVHGGSGFDVFCFRLFRGIIFFFLAPFLYFLGLGAAATSARRPGSVAGCRPSALSLSALLSPRSFLLRLRSLLRPFRSVLGRLARSSPRRLGSAPLLPQPPAPSPLFLAAFSSPSLFLPVPNAPTCTTITHISPSVPSPPPTASRPSLAPK